MTYLNTMKNILYTVLATFLLIACTGKEDRIRTGDLLFVGIPLDYSLEEGSMTEAIASATSRELNLIHVAILEVDSADSVWVIDATLKHGVDRHPWSTFVKDFTLKDGSLPTFLFMRLKDNRGVEQYVENAKQYCGQPYDGHFLPDNGALYCSELVRESYRTAEGAYLFEEKPMNFKNKDGEFPLYWQQLFGIIGEPIPQDIPGTNPQDMYTSARLEAVPVKILP